MSSTFTSPLQFSIGEVLDRNEKYAAAIPKGQPSLLQRVGGDMKANGPHVVVIACIDSRCNPYEVFDFKLSEIISLRNPGGRINSFLTDLSAMDTFFGINQIIILQHSDCGATHVTVEQQIENVKSKCPDVSEEELAVLIQKTPCKEDTDESVKEDLARLRECNFIPKNLRENSIGFFLDVQTGLVRQVK